MAKFKIGDLVNPKVPQDWMHKGPYTIYIIYNGVANVRYKTKNGNWSKGDYRYSFYTRDLILVSTSSIFKDTIYQMALKITFNKKPLTKAKKSVKVPIPSWIKKPNRRR